MAGYEFRKLSVLEISSELTENWLDYNKSQGQHIWQGRFTDDVLCYIH